MAREAKIISKIKELTGIHVEIHAARSIAITGVDESLSYSDFAKAVATILKNEYGVHNYDKFMEVLHSELGMNEEISDYEMVL